MGRVYAFQVGYMHVATSSMNVLWVLKSEILTSSNTLGKVFGSLIALQLLSYTEQPSHSGPIEHDCAFAGGRLWKIVCLSIQPGFLPRADVCLVNSRRQHQRFLCVSAFNVLLLLLLRFVSQWWRTMAACVFLLTLVA